MDDQRDLLERRPAGFQCRKHTVSLVVGCTRYLGDADLAGHVIEADHVREGAADIDADPHAVPGSGIAVGRAGTFCHGLDQSHE